METLQPTLKRGRDVWDAIRMPESEFHRRIERMRSEMKRRRMDVLLLYGIGQNDYGHPCYISSYLSKVPQGTIAVIPSKGKVALICQGFVRDAALIQDTTWLTEIRSGEDLVQKCSEYLKEKKLIRSRIGFTGLSQYMPFNQYQALSEAVGPSRIVEASDLISRMRMVKSERECDQIRRSSSIVAECFDLLMGSSFPGLTQRLIEAEVSRAGYLEGAEDVRVLIGKPKDANWSFRPPEDAQLCEGETLILYIAVEFERYWAEGIRTFVVKETSLSEAPSGYAKVLHEKIINGLTAGKSISTFYKETLTRIKRSKHDWLPDYGLGQGIGLSLEEPPFFRKDDPTLLKKGMCFALRLALKDGDSGVLMLGETIHLSRSGPEILTRTRRTSA